MMFDNVLRCLVSHVTIGDCVAADHLRDRDNSAEIGNNAAWIGDITSKVITC